MAASAADFTDEYLRSWIEPDPERRRALIMSMWAPDGRLTVSSPAMVVEGVDRIVDHVTSLYDALKDLDFVYDQQIESGDALLLRWSMSTPAGELVKRGVNIVFRNAQGRVSRVHMFMGVD